MSAPDQLLTTVNAAKPRDITKHIATALGTAAPKGDERSLTTTHFAFSVLIGMILSMDRDEWFVAITFGVLIDADHLFAAPRYISDNGWGAILAPSWDDGSGLPWKSSFHHPEGVFVVGYLSIGWRFWIPLLFWASHLGLDELQQATIAHSAAVESVLLVGTVGGIVLVNHRRWRALHPEGDVRAYARYLADDLANLLRRRKRQVI